MNFRPRRREVPELNLIPMIDVLIVLLIFLVLTTTFSRETELQIQLPEATGEASHEEHNIEIVIDAEGHYTINGKQVVYSEPKVIKKMLQDAAVEQPDPIIVIDADRNTTHQSVMTILDMTAQLGYKQITFATRTEPGE